MAILGLDNKQLEWTFIAARLTRPPEHGAPSRDITSDDDEPTTRFGMDVIKQ
jgi:hypothetical protein